MKSRPLKRSLGAALFLLAAGCSSGGDEFPLEVGNTWTFQVRSGLTTRIAELRVVSRAPVAGVNGYELGGAAGSGRAGWKDGVLLAGQMAGSSFEPPIPLLVAGGNAASREWSGRMSYLGAAAPATATLHQAREVRQVRGRQADTVRCTLKLRLRGRQIELVTWYLPGHGPIAQQQRTDGLLDLDLLAVDTY